MFEHVEENKIGQLAQEEALHRSLSSEIKYFLNKMNLYCWGTYIIPTDFFTWKQKPLKIMN
jgi:hypothetical protein